MLLSLVFLGELGLDGCFLASTRSKTESSEITGVHGCHCQISRILREIPYFSPRLKTSLHELSSF